MEEEDETKSKRVRLDVAIKLQIIAAVEGGQLQLDVAKQFGVKPKSKFAIVYIIYPTVYFDLTISQNTLLDQLECIA